MSSALALKCVIFLVLASLVALVIGGMKRRPPATPFVARPLLNDAELDFYKRLRHALPEYQVLPQVSLGALVQPTQAGCRHARAQGRIAQARVDYVIAARADLSILALVELDDRAEMGRRDAERDQLTASAGYTTHRFSFGLSPTSLAIRETLLGPPTAEIVLLPRPDSPDRPVRS